GSRIGVSEGDFGRFVDREIMSRFPNGLTVFNAAGQWREQARDKIVREPSKVVQIVLPGQVDDIARLNENRRGLQDPLQAAIGGQDRAAGLRVVLAAAAWRAESAPRPRLRPRRALPNYLHNVGNADGGSARHGAGEVRRP